MKIIFKSNIMYNSFMGAVKYSQTIVVGLLEFKIHFGNTSRIVSILCELFKIEIAS